MRIDEIKNRYRKKLTALSGLLVFIIVGIYFLASENQKSEQTLSLINNDIGTVNKHLTALNSVAEQFKESYVLWKALFKNDKVLTGLKINDAQTLIEKYKNTYHLSHVEVNLSKPVILQSLSSNSGTDVVSSEVSITFKGLTDEYVLSFIRAMMRELPGYIQFKSLTLNMDGEITNEVLYKVSQEQYPGLVNAEWVFYWRDLKTANFGDNPQPEIAVPANPAELPS